MECIIFNNLLFCTKLSTAFNKIINNKEPSSVKQNNGCLYLFLSIVFPMSESIYIISQTNVCVTTNSYYCLDSKLNNTEATLTGISPHYFVVVIVTVNITVYTWCVVIVKCHPTLPLAG